MSWCCILKQSETKNDKEAEDAGTIVEVQTETTQKAGTMVEVQKKEKPKREVSRLSYLKDYV